MDEIRNLLDEQIKTEIQNLDYLEMGSKEKQNAIDGIAKLYELRLSENKAETAQIENQARMELDTKKVENEIDDDKVKRKGANLDRWISLGLQIAIPLGTFIAYDIWHRRGLKFEETGTITSPWTRNLMSKMTPKN